MVVSSLVLGFLGLAVSAVASGLTSTHGIQMCGVYADGRTVVVNGRTIKDTSVFELYFQSLDRSPPSVTRTVSTETEHTEEPTRNHLNEVVIAHVTEA